MVDEHDVRTVLDFWFRPRSDPDFGLGRPVWFMTDPTFDKEVRDCLGDLQMRASRYAFDHWRAVPESAVALVILLDQAPRNLFRGTARCFETDSYALDVSRQAVQRRFDQELPEVMRLFLYLPFEHSEDLHDQDTFIRLAREMGDPNYAFYGQLHRKIIERFGRFPHRNRALGRPSTPAEQAYLDGGGMTF